MSFPSAHEALKLLAVRGSIFLSVSFPSAHEALKLATKRSKVVRYESFPSAHEALKLSWLVWSSVPLKSFPSAHEALKLPDGTVNADASTVVPVRPRGIETCHVAADVLCGVGRSRPPTRH